MHLCMVVCVCEVVSACICVCSEDEALGPHRVGEFPVLRYVCGYMPVCVCVCVCVCDRESTCASETHTRIRNIHTYT